MIRTSIVIPTFNGVATIRECLDCIRGQSFVDFEAIICDNASTDGTSEICAEVAAADSRFVHIRNDKTIPALENFKQGLGLARAPYFMWRADDDLTDENHLRSTVRTLDENPDVKLAVTKIHRINTTSGREADYPLPVSSGKDRLSRATATLLGCHPSWFYGLWRREAAVDGLSIVKAYPYLWAFDHLVTMRAMLHGEVAFVTDSVFIQRIMREGFYHLDPVERLAARKAYVALSRKLIADTDYSENEKAVLRGVLEKHANKRVAPWFKTHKRALRARVARFFRLVPPTYR
ncbi:glycosyltransferase [Sinorhizobium meliloti]|uniref:glycosyltransferase family 2 protein n=1 Tax=Rhizobium meliloti TaxID=382 RepID=UPI001295FBC5|nr:glycosyltransferase family A protein [Sinorhizobium meliloti]MDW9592864.1 glycosyltransferase [Sinorhizobium meliloti]MDX0187631.1 glycosyltransferase [Sinorhizobium meliloti]MQV09172.1 glycosyltransferase [Sinorhizobium meliloti]MQV63342.1 glycosyltransferase [Sinorhizobium meliloti]